MKTVTIEDTAAWRVESHGNGFAYSFTCKGTGATGYLQGDDATQWRENYDAMGEAFSRPDSVWSRGSWDACLAELCGDYVANESL